MAIKNFKEILQKEAQRVDIKDRKIFERGTLPSFFGRGETDTIEFILYDNGDNQLPQGENGKLVRYVNISDIENIRKYILIARGKTSNSNAEYFVDIERLINEAGYKNGLFRTQITLLNKRVGSEANQNKVWIHEIAPSRTEIRVLPIKPDSKLMEDDLNNRYNIFLRNGEFRDDVVNRLDGFIDTISTESVLKKVNSLYGSDWIKNLQKEFKIDSFERFIDTCVIKSKEAIGYYIRNRQYKITSKDYGKPMLVNKNQQSFDISTLVKTSNEIICDVIAFNLPKRNVNTQNVASTTKLESIDRIETVLQKFGKSKKIDTDVSVTKRVIKPLKVTKAKVGNLSTPRKVKEKPAPPTPIKIVSPPKRYYFYQLLNLPEKRRRIFGIRKKDFKVVRYTKMDGDSVSFTLPDGKSARICALEGSVKADKGVRVEKKELCVTDTPVPTFVEPKVKDEIKPIELTKEQKELIKNLPDIDTIKENIKFEFQPIKFDMEKMKREIAKNIKLPKITFPKYIGAPGATGDAGAARGFFLNVGNPFQQNNTGGLNIKRGRNPFVKRRNDKVSKRKPTPKPRVKTPSPFNRNPFIPQSIKPIKTNKPALTQVRKRAFQNITSPKRSRVKSRPSPAPKPAPIIFPKPSRGRVSLPKSSPRKKSSIFNRRRSRTRTKPTTFLGRKPLTPRTKKRGIFGRRRRGR